MSKDRKALREAREAEVAKGNLFVHGTKTKVTDVKQLTDKQRNTIDKRTRKAAADKARHKEAESKRAAQRAKQVAKESAKQTAKKPGKQASNHTNSKVISNGTGLSKDQPLSRKQRKKAAQRALQAEYQGKRKVKAANPPVPPSISGSEYSEIDSSNSSVSSVPPKGRAIMTRSQAAARQPVLIPSAAASRASSRAAAHQPIYISSSSPLSSRSPSPPPPPPALNLAPPQPPPRPAPPAYGYGHLGNQPAPWRAGPSTYDHNQIPHQPAPPPLAYDYGRFPHQAAATAPPTYGYGRLPQQSTAPTYDSYDYGQLARQAAAGSAGPSQPPQLPSPSADWRSDPFASAAQPSSSSFVHATRLCDLPPKEQALQTRYFGLTHPESTIRCLSCGEKGHIPQTCPGRFCTHCSAVDLHPSSACPENRKCTRCRARGHTAELCLASYTRPPGPRETCDICGETGHVEEECSRLWKTYIPSPTDAKKMPLRDMRRGCYYCGSGSHWGGNCTRLPLYERREREGTNRVWNAEYAAQFTETEYAEPPSEIRIGYFDFSGLER